MNITTIKPGLLVSLKTTVKGNVRYERVVLEEGRIAYDGSLQAKWETEKTVHDPMEHESAKKARAEARYAIASVCASSAFGLLCPSANEEELNQACDRANAIIAVFNQTAQHSKIGLFVMVGRVDAQDPRAIAAINSEIADLLMDMGAALQGKDVKTAREAANKARQLCAILTDDAASHVSVAINATREAARALAKNGETDIGYAVHAIMTANANISA